MARGGKRSYVRDGNGRFASSPGGGGGKARPAARRAATRAGNRLNRDNAGRISGIGRDGATVRGGRIKTAKGARRATQTAALKAGGFRAGTIAKGGRGVSGSVARSLAAAKRERAGRPGVGAAAAKPGTGRVTYRTRSQAAAAQAERNRRVYEFAKSTPGDVRMNGMANSRSGESLVARKAKVNQGNLLTGKVETVTAKASYTPASSAIKPSMAAKKTEVRRARAEARYDSLLTQKKEIMAQRRVKAGTLAKVNQRLSAVGQAFRAYDMGTGRKEPRRTTMQGRRRI